MNCFSILQFWIIFRSIVFNIIYCVGAGVSTLISISDELCPYIFCGKVEKTQSMGDEMDGKMLISRQSGHFPFR